MRITALLKFFREFMSESPVTGQVQTNYYIIVQASVSDSCFNGLSWC